MHEPERQREGTTGGSATGPLLAEGEPVGQWGDEGDEGGVRGVVRALGAGLVGALTLSLLHESARRFGRDAPRMDVIGERGIELLFQDRAPRGRALYRTALTGDLLTNTLYYGALLLGRPDRPWMREGLGGLAAGAGALYLPQLLGLGKPPKKGRPATKLMTIAWYLAGGMAAAAAHRLFARR